MYERRMRWVERHVELSRGERYRINRRAHELAMLAEVAYRTKLVDIALRDKAMDGVVDLEAINRIVPEIDQLLDAYDE